MSTHVFTLNPAIDYFAAYPELNAAMGVAPVSYIPDSVLLTVTLVYAPDLTSAQVTTLTSSMTDLGTMAHFGVSSDITLTEFQAIKPDIATGKSYLGLASPTNAQSVAAIKSLIRVVGTLLRS